MHYKDIGCTPVYADPQPCCPYKWNCDHLNERSTDKCYVNGHEYNIGDDLRDEDANPCDIGCSCRESRGVSVFISL